MRKVELAAFLGVLQSTLTKFNYISKEATQNQQEDPIVGISLTGLMDCPEFLFPSEDIPAALAVLKDTARESVGKWCAHLGLKVPQAITCVKPSGTVSQLVDSSSGVHPRFSDYYLRRIQVSDDDPLCKHLKDLQAPNEQYKEVPGSTIFVFPFKAPEGAVTSLSLEDQLKVVSLLNDHWCDHNTSCTIYVGKDEWGTLLDLLYDYDNIKSLSFLPKEIVSGETSSFPYLPFEKISRKQYEEFWKHMKMPLGVDFKEIVEPKDLTEPPRVCEGDKCSIR